jgi:hypothetical protein
MSNKKSIINWLNQLAEDGKEITMKWEGGGDSGWVYFEVGGETIDNEYSEALLNYMYDVLDYGSWAGEFTANGEATYQPETKSFTGTDYYSEDDWDSLECNQIIEVPKHLWFESLHVEVESNHDEPPNVSVLFIVKNGFISQEHLDFCSNLEEILKDNFEAVFDNYKGKDEFRGCNDSWILERSEATEDEDEMLVFDINTVEIQTYQSSDKDVYLELTEEIIENIDNKLNQSTNDED